MPRPTELITAMGRSPDDRCRMCCRQLRVCTCEDFGNAPGVSDLAMLRVMPNDNDIGPDDPTGVWVFANVRRTDLAAYLDENYPGWTDATLTRTFRNRG